MAKCYMTDRNKDLTSQSCQEARARPVTKAVDAGTGFRKGYLWLCCL